MSLTGLDTSDKQNAQTVSAALELLELLSQHPRSSLSQLSKRSGNSLNRTFRLLSALEQAGLVVKDQHKTYRLGPQLMLLGRRAQAQDPLVQAAEPTMSQLAQQTGQAISLAVRIGTQRIVVAQRAAQQPLGVAPNYHDRLPLHWGALGCCLLAFAPPQVQQEVLSGPLPAFSPQTITQPHDLLQHLQTVRQQGYDQALEAELDIFSIAAPILSNSGWAVGALNISGRLSSLQPQQQSAYPHLLRVAAEQIAVRLGGQLDPVAL